MEHHRQFAALLAGPEPMLALAPMQDVTDRAFWHLMVRYGGADVYFTEYCRVHASSRPERWVLDSILRNPTGRPVVAQVIGNDIPALIRTARELQQYPIVAVDFNLGCPAPVVCRKAAGGGLLRDPRRADAILGALRDAVAIKFSVKTRIGFDSAAAFDDLLAIFAKHALDLLTVHARTVTEGYGPTLRYDLIAQAARALPCPVLANGNIHSAAQAEALWRQTGARGLMIGRGAIRNPWVFRQIREHLRGERPFMPSGRDVLAYVHALYKAMCAPGVRESAQVERMKKFMNYVGEGVEPTGRFLHDIRRVGTAAAFFRVCEEHLDHRRPLPLEPCLQSAACTI